MHFRLTFESFEHSKTGEALDAGVASDGLSKLKLDAVDLNTMEWSELAVRARQLLSARR